ncbi:disease resistance protein RPM1 [Morus notabilis]|uniref:disease resistance protein RPM1 n=1 Tax=Morus notabilis TaxID=981085 RepID=UPI000CED3674|nr:disease resistance protein RPM1 [Morus notabilis]
MEAASIAIYVIDKALSLLEKANGDMISLKLKLESLQELVMNKDAQNWIAEEWLTDAAKAAQRAGYVLDMYLLQAAERPDLVIWSSKKRKIYFHCRKDFGEGDPILVPKRTRTVPVKKIRFSEIKSSRIIEEGELVGVKAQKEELVSMLVGETSTRLAISLVGVGGVGKTSLASTVYQSEEVRRHFDLRAWINVSQSCSFENLFRRLTKMICEDGDSSEEEMDTMQEQELISRLKQLLSPKRLFEMCIAEGFVKGEIGKALEQVAEIVHGVMHEVLVSKAKQFEICQIFEDKDSSSLVDPESRRLSLHGGAINTLEITVDQSRVRSIFLFDFQGTIMTRCLEVSLFERFKLLELLDFENTPLDDLPMEVGNLFFLKCLNLRNTKLKKLPKSLGLLLNLQSLDVRNTLINVLPIEIQKLRKLRHLLASSHNGNVPSCSISGARIKEGICSLENLQTLMTVEAQKSRRS